MVAVEYACILAIAASAASLAISIYAATLSKRGILTVRMLVRAASLRERIARSLAKLSKKPRKRYIVFEVVSSKPISREQVEMAIHDSIRKLYGAVGSSMAWAALIDYDEVSRRGILRVRSDYKYWALAALAAVREIGGARVIIVPLAVHGTVKRARKRVFRY